MMFVTENRVENHSLQHTFHDKIGITTSGDQVAQPVQSAEMNMLWRESTHCQAITTN